MNLNRVLVLFLTVILLWTHIQCSLFVQDLEIPITDFCGNVEFNVNYMLPKITIYDSYLIQNMTLTDYMEESYPMNFVLGGNAK